MLTYLPYVLQCTPETLLDNDTPIYPGVKKGDGVNNDCDSAEGEEINNGLGMNWAATQENLSSVVFEQKRCRPACSSAQSDQRLCYSLF